MTNLVESPAKCWQIPTMADTDAKVVYPDCTTLKQIVMKLVNMGAIPLQGNPLVWEDTEDPNKDFLYVIVPEPFLMLAMGPATDAPKRH